jgi:hypothetical protein
MMLGGAQYAAGAWLDATWGLTDIEFAIAAQTRAAIPAFHPPAGVATLTCLHNGQGHGTREIDPRGWHRLACRQTHGGKVLQHNRVVAAITKFANKATRPGQGNVDVTHEPDIPGLGYHVKPGYVAPAGNQEACVRADVAVTTTSAANERSSIMIDVAIRQPDVDHETSWQHGTGHAEGYWAAQAETHHVPGQVADGQGGPLCLRHGVPGADRAARHAGGGHAGSDRAASGEV